MEHIPTLMKVSTVTTSLPGLRVVEGWNLRSMRTFQTISEGEFSEVRAGLESVASCSYPSKVITL